MGENEIKLNGEVNEIMNEVAETDSIPFLVKAGVVVMIGGAAYCVYRFVVRPLVGKIKEAIDQHKTPKVVVVNAHDVDDDSTK